jgi:hypothetical protein
MVGRYPLAIIPHRELTPAGCAALAVAIEDAIEVLELWHIRVRPDGRLRQAARHLTRVATAGSYGADAAELARTAAAIRLANDIYVITRTLPADRQAVIAEEFAPILGGTLDGDSSDRRAYEAQTQFWIGALLAFSELHPHIPGVTVTKRPDYEIRVDDVWLAVEVKRPSATAGISRGILVADRQIRSAKRPGFIVLDVTDLHPPVSPGRAHAPDRDAGRRAFDDIAEQVRQFIRTRQPRELERIIGVFIVSRYCVWSDTAASALELGFLVSATTFPAACAGLYEHYAGRVLDRIVPGIRRMTGNPLREMNRGQ